MAVLTERALRAMSRAVQRFLEQNPFDVGRPEHFEALVAAVARPVGCQKDEFRVATAMLILGPEDPGKIDSRTVGMLGEVLAQLRAVVPDLVERVARALEFAVAYGCGWGREPDQIGRAHV